MNTSLRTCVLLAAVISLTFSSSVSLAAETESVPADKASDFVHCDGKANTESSLSLAARLIALSLVVGLLIPEHEQDNVKLRRSGAEGIKACDAALNGQEKASDGGRRLELIMGRAIHRMEIGEWQAAIDDLHTLPNDQPALTATRAYRQSLGQTVAFLEGISLVAKGDNAGAVTVGHKIVKESFYDPYAIRLGTGLVMLEDGYGQEKQQVMDQMVRLNPSQISSRATARATAGDFKGAGDDYAAYATLLMTMPDTQGYVPQALAAIGYRLGGDAQKADELFNAAQLKVDADTAEGKRGSLVDAFREIADFYAIVVAFDGGQDVRARNMLSAHSHWKLVGSGYVAELARRLQTVGTPEQQAISPIQTPQQVADERRKALVATILSKGDNNDKYWGYFIASYSDAAYGKLAPNVWKSKNSPYLSKTVNKEMNGQYADTSANGSGVPCAYAMYMHMAVMAKAQGKSGFMVLPGQKYRCSGFFRIGNADDKDMVPAFMMDADKVMSDLETYFPKPAA